MKVKTKSSSTLNTKIPTTPKNSLLPSNKPKGLIQDSNPSTAVKATRKKVTPSGKQNMQTSNVPSPQNNLRNKNYKPRLKKQPKLGLSNTISLIINQSQHSPKKNDLLGSLLYGQFDLTYSQDLRTKEEENDQLLIDTCEQKEQKITFKYCNKNLSPIKSISEYSVNQNQNQVFIVQKANSKTANAILKIKIINLTQSQQKSKLNCVLYRRLLVLFKQKKECLIKLYTTIHQAITKQDLQLKIRQFLFQNAIIFNKAQLNQFIEQIYKTISDINTDSKHEFCQQNIEILMQRLFLYVPKNNNSSQLQENIWICQDIFDKLFYDRNTISIWKLVRQLCVQARKQIQTSFRQSRFCLSMDTTMFIHQTDQKRKNETVSQIQKYLIKYLMPSQFDVKSTIDMLQNKQVNNEQIKITVIPPPLRSNIN